MQSKPIPEDAGGVIERTGDNGEILRCCLYCSEFKSEGEYTPYSWKTHGAFRTRRGGCRTACRNCSRRYQRERSATLRAARRHCEENGIDLNAYR